MPAIPVAPRRRGGEVAAFSLARIGACVDEFRFIGVERDVVPAGAARAGGDKGFLSIRKSSRA